MNRTPLWKNIFILVIVLLGLIYSLPNLYREDPSVQVSPSRSELIDAVLEKQISDALGREALTPKSIERTERSMLIRFSDEESQLKAKDIIGAELGDGYIVALNLASTTPAWLVKLGGKPMYLGLDLRGGVHFLMGVDTKAAVMQGEERFVADLRSSFREEKIRYKSISRKEGGGLTVTFADTEKRAAAEKIITRHFPELQIVAETEGAEPAVELKITDAYVLETKKFAVQQNLTTLRNRVNELGVSEPVIQQQGEDQIVVQLPGVQDTARAKEILGATATLEFHMVDTEHDLAEAEKGQVPPASKLYKMREGGKVLLQKQVLLTGEYIVDAASGFDQSDSRPNVSIQLDSKGGAMFERATRDNVGKPMAVVFIENKTRTVKQGSEMVKVKERVEEVINVATIREQLGRRFQITGLDSTHEARNLALLLRAGALAAPIEIIEERTVGPSLGAENIKRGFHSTWVGFAAIAVFMIIYYLIFGVTSVIALAVNVLLLIALLSILQATLTLPGMAAIALTVGMAIDSNVLINERIREELRNGNTPQASITAGYERAFGTILDTNITTLIAGLALLTFGSGPVRGFAVVLCLGILTSMFSSVAVSRSLVNLLYGGRRKLARLAIGNTTWK
jgi:preprotein translocase subunit SecD